jgi:hypothetical protein
MVDVRDWDNPTEEERELMDLEEMINELVTHFEYRVNIEKEHNFVRFEVEYWPYTKGIPKHIKKTLEEYSAQLTNIIPNYGAIVNYEGKEMPTTLIEIELGRNTKLQRQIAERVWSEVIAHNLQWIKTIQEYQHWRLKER